MKYNEVRIFAFCSTPRKYLYFRSFEQIELLLCGFRKILFFILMNYLIDKFLNSS